jgi:hypothetical protein
MMPQVNPASESYKTTTLIKTAMTLHCSMMSSIIQELLIEEHYNTLSRDRSRD